MRGSFYATLKTTRLYGLYLKHRVWVARSIQSAHLLYCFPLGSLALVWFALPASAFSLGSLLLFAPENLGLFGVSFGIFLIATAPFTVCALVDTFVGYFAGFANVLGNATQVKLLQTETENTLAEWNAEYA